MAKTTNRRPLSVRARRKEVTGISLAAIATRLARMEAAAQKVADRVAALEKRCTKLEYDITAFGA